MKEFKTLTTPYGPRIYVDRVVRTPAAGTHLWGPAPDEVIAQLNTFSLEGNTSNSATYYMWRFHPNEINYLKAVGFLVGLGWKHGKFWQTASDMIRGRFDEP